jgi:hypothetical protein
LNKSSIGISGCFFSLPLFKIFQYSFGSDVFRFTLKQKVTEAEKHYKNTLDKNSKNYRKKMREELKKSKNI